MFVGRVPGNSWEGGVRCCCLSKGARKYEERSVFGGQDRKPGYFGADIVRKSRIVSGLVIRKDEYKVMCCEVVRLVVKETARKKLLRLRDEQSRNKFLRMKGKMEGQLEGQLP